MQEDMGENPSHEKIRHLPNAQEIYSQIQGMKRQLADMGSIDSEMLQEYEKTKERHTFLTKQIEDLQKTISSLKKVISSLDSQIQEQFHHTFKKQFTHLKPQRHPMTYYFPR